MRWHAEERRDDEILRHPADSDAWKNFDKKHVGTRWRLVMSG